MALWQLSRWLFLRDKPFGRRDFLTRWDLQKVLMERNATGTKDYVPYIGSLVLPAQTYLLVRQ
jgi:hypothetical protein